MLKLSKRDREIMSRMVFIPPRRRGKIDPKLMRKVLLDIYKQRSRQEVEVKTRARADREVAANGHPLPAEAE